MNRRFFDRPATAVAPDLIGHYLIHDTPAGRVGGIIVETEAYMGELDPASHAYNGPTRRSRAMFGPPGHAYIYFTYGMHYCFNVVCGPGGEASAVLIRALEPTIGSELMRRNRGPVADHQLTNGPAKLVQALGITMADYGHDLLLLPLQIIPGDQSHEIATSSRTGIRQATDRPWRYYSKTSPYVSRTRTQKTSQTPL